MIVDFRDECAYNHATTNKKATNILYATIVCAQLTKLPLKLRTTPVSLSLYFEAILYEKTTQQTLKNPIRTIREPKSRDLRTSDDNK